MERSRAYITTQEAANALGYSLQHTRRLIKNGDLKGEKQGRDWFTAEDAIIEYKSIKQQFQIAKEAKTNAAGQFELYEEISKSKIVNVSTVPKRSPFRYPGGKTWLIPTIRQWLNSKKKQPTLLVEPFAGGASVGLTVAFEGLAKSALLVEMDRDVAAIWETILSDNYETLIKLILNFDCTRENVITTLTTHSSNKTEEAFKVFLKNRVSRGGILAAGAGFSKQGEAGKGIASRWYPNTLAERIKAIHSNKNNIQFICGDGLEIMRQKYNEENTAFFIDPPYVVAGKRLYKHYELDHAQLFREMATLKGDFLATYDHNIQIEGLASEHGFDTLLIPMKSTHHQTKYELLIGKDLSWAKD